MAGLDHGGFPSPNESMILSMKNNKKNTHLKIQPRLKLKHEHFKGDNFCFLFCFGVFEFFKLKQHFKRHQISRYQTFTRKLIVAMPENSTPPLSKNPLTTLVVLAYGQSSQPSECLHTLFASPGGYWSTQYSTY